jgi:hypothetical protein
MIKKYLDYGNGYRIDITNDEGLAEFFPAPKDLKGKWVFPKLIIVEEIGRHEIELRNNRLPKSTKSKHGGSDKKIR